MPSPVIAHIVVMGTIMPAAVGAIMMRTRIVKMVRIGISDINPERPAPTAHINRAEEVGSLHETGVLPATQHPTQIVIAHIQIIIVTVQRPFLTPQHIIHQITHTGNEVIINFIHIVILCCIQVQFISHLIRKETRLFTYSTVAHRSMTNGSAHYCCK